MKKINIEVDEIANEILIPENWNEVTIAMYKRMNKVDKSLPDQIYIEETIREILNLEYNIMECMYVSDFEIIKENLSFLFNEKLENKLNEFIEINGEKYYCYNDFNKLTMGEKTTMNLIMEKYSGDLIDSYSELLCLLLRKKKDNGKLETFKSEMMMREKMFNEVSINDVNGLLLFFSNTVNEL